MDITTILGPVLGVGLIVLGMILEGGHVQSIIQLTALIIVGGGTLGAVLASFPMEHTLQALKALKKQMLGGHRTSRS